MTRDHPRAIRVIYTNYAGKTDVRHITPLLIRFGSNKWHPRPQYLLVCIDHDRGNQEREYALESCDFAGAMEGSDAAEAVDLCAGR
jgi:hypothetical protein